MNTFLTSIPFSRTQKPLWVFVTVAIALIAGLLLSVLSWFELCVEHCSANQDYRLFGIPFAIVGISFFSALVIVHLLSRSFPFLANIVEWSVALAFGSEIMFIIVQKTQIGHWCPVCLSIAAAVGIAGLSLGFNGLKNLYANNQSRNSGEYMLRIKQAGTILFLILCGFFSSFVGIHKIDAAQEAQAEIKDKLVFGNKNSNVQVYFFTDWYCPSCKKVEPIIEKTFPAIKSQVAFYFIDYAIHKKSLNYTPYNLAFQIYTKPQYFKARNMLADLAENNESPTDEDIVEAAHKKGISFKELSFLDVKNGIEFSDSLVKKYDLSATPTLIITNKAGTKVVKLEGRDEISDKALKEAIDKVKKSS